MEKHWFDAEGIETFVGAYGDTPLRGESYRIVSPVNEGLHDI